MKIQKKFDPFANLVLDNEEKEIEAALERGEYVPDSNAEINKMFEEAAEAYPELLQSKSITLRVSQKDLIRIKAKAKRTNVPYQSLINMLINSYVEGKTKLVI